MKHTARPIKSAFSNSRRRSRPRLELLETRTLLSSLSTGNLLLNPGAENGTGNDGGSTVTNWTVGGTSNPGRDNGTFDDFTPHSGLYDFYGGSGPLGTLTQTVSLSSLSTAFLSAIDGGQISANVEFFEQSLNQGIPSDAAEVKITFLDGSNDPLSGGYDSGQVVHFNGWEEITASTPVPADTRSITYQMIFTRQQGSDLDSYIDDNSLTLTNEPGLSFTPQSTQAVGNDPSSIASADFNGDGNADLVVANNADGTISVLFGNGDGTFQTAATYGGFNYPNCVVAADVNGDGKPDILVTDGDAYVSVLINNGNGTFKSPHNIFIPAGITTFPQALAVADLSGNGDADLVVAGGTSGNGSVSVLMGNGNGTFKTPTAYTFPEGTDNITSVAVADLNGDGHPDIIATDANNNEVDVLLNNGNGTFKAATQFATAYYPIAVAAADLTGDGKIDLAVACNTSSYAGTVSILMGNGDGTFSAAANIDAGYSPTEVDLVDLNGDSHPDLIVANSEVDTVTILPGNGDGTFGAATSLLVGNAPAALAVADLNGDGRPDVVTANSTDNTISALLNATPSAVSVTNNNGTVSVVGTSINDTASITYSNGMIVFVNNGQTQSFSKSSTSMISISLGSGQNNFMVGANVPAVSVASGSGDDTVMAANGSNDSLVGGAGDNDFQVTGGADMLMGGSGNNTLMGGGAGTLIMGKGGTGILAPGSSGETVKGGTGTDTISSTAGGDMLKGGNGPLKVFLTAGAAGPDSIVGGSGLDFAQYNPNDSMTNIFQVIDPPKDAAAPTVIERPFQSGTATVANGVLTIEGTPDPDTIAVTLNAKDTNAKVDLNGVLLGKFPLTELTGIAISGGAGADTLSVESSISLPATLSGGGGADSITGGGGDNVLVGAGGSDTLTGGGGTNLLIADKLLTYADGPTGSDSLVGGSGFNIADFAYRTDNMTLANNGLSTGGEIISSSVQAIWGGTGSDSITGTTPGDFLSGGAGADTIQGGSAGDANDLIVGGKGKDSVTVAAEPVALYMKDGKADTIAGVSNQSEDILILDPGGLDSLQA
jgi:Ca2+-binding RTX toxin-like protein